MENKGLNAIIRAIRRRVASVVSRWAYRFTRMLPLDNKWVVFESERDFCDNSWALYRYLMSHDTNLHFTWLCHSRETIDRLGGSLSRTEFVFAHGNSVSLRGLRGLSQAKFIFYTHGISAMARRRKKQVVVNLWHGIALKGRKVSDIAVQSRPYFSCALCLGRQNVQSQASFLNCTEDWVVPLGYPRNDLLIDNVGSGRCNPFAPQGFSGKVILWMPTFRASMNRDLSEDSVDTETGLPLLDSVEKVEQFNDFLVEENVHVIVKIHHLQAGKRVFGMKFSNITFITDETLEDKGIQLYEMLGKSDALISDYSSVVVDYLLTDKPMGFILDDFDEYASSRGLFLFENVKELFAGEHIYDEQELFCFVKNVSVGIDNSKHNRQTVRNLMIDNQDNMSCERIVGYCGIGVDIKTIDKI